jgi:gluconolactonase
VRIDADGNVWCAVAHGDASEDGVRCYAPDGALIGKVHLPEGAANLCFGGPRRNRLFMAAGTSVYALYLSAEGSQKP